MGADVLIDLTPLDTASRFTGTGRYIHELGHALAALDDREREGLSISGLVALEGPDAEGPLTYEAGARRHDIDGETAWLNRRRCILPFTLRRLRPRLFHATYPLGTPRLSGVPRVVTCHDMLKHVLHEEYLPGQPLYRRLLFAADWLRFHGAARVVANSEHTANDLIRLCNVPASRVDVVYMGVDLTRYHPFAGEEAFRADQVRQRYGVTKGNYLYYLGTADPRKNVDILIEGYARSGVELPLLLLGRMRPSDMKCISAAMERADQPAGVRLVGLVPDADLPALVEGALGLVFCANYEGFGIPPVEAMACGCPVIHTGLTSMRETMGDAGLIIPDRNIDATASAIRSLVSDSALRRQLSEAGLVRAQRFTWRNTAMASVQSYVKALSGLTETVRNVTGR
jgi:glycosyltransferase involved in cell wall biosynthesis